MGEDGQLSCPGDGFPWLLVAGVRARRSQASLWVAPYHLANAWREFVEEVDSRVAPDRRTKIGDGHGSGSRPIRTVSSMDSDRSQRTEEIGTIQPALPGVIPRDKDARSSITGPSQDTTAG